jgi:hypothetical protein
MFNIENIMNTELFSLQNIKLLNTTTNISSSYLEIHRVYFTLAQMSLNINPSFTEVRCTRSMAITNEKITHVNQL